MSTPRPLSTFTLEDRPGPEGLAAWSAGADTRVRPGALAPLIAVGSALPYAPTGRLRAVPTLLTSRFGVWVASTDANPTAVEVEVRAGLDCDGVTFWRGIWTPGGNGVDFVVQLSGLLTNRWEVWGRIVEGAETSVAFRLHVDRAGGGGYAITWGPNVARSFPVGALNALP